MSSKSFYTLAPRYLWVLLDSRLEIANGRGERLKPGGILEYHGGKFSVLAQWVKTKEKEYLVEFANGSRCWVGADACEWAETPEMN